MQGAQVQFLAQEDPTCGGTPQLLKPCSRAHEPQVLSSYAWNQVCTMRGANIMRSPCTTTRSNLCSLQLEKAHMQQ